METTSNFLYVALTVSFYLLQVATGNLYLKAVNISYSSLRVNITKSDAAALQHCLIHTVSKFDSSDRYISNFTGDHFLIVGLKSNVVYLSKATCHFTSGSGVSNVVEARTYPNGASVTTSLTSPHIFTAFLEVIPGASQWILEWTDHHKHMNFSQALADPYKIFLNATADTWFTLRARISRVNAVFLAEAESPFGQVTTVRTGTRSYFGRVVILEEEYSETDESDWLKWEQDLLDEYTKLCRATKVVILETANSSSPQGVLVHHEIFVGGATAQPVSTMIFSDARAYSNQIVTEDVDPAYVFGINRVTATTFRTYAFDFVNSVARTCDDKKTSDKWWILNSHDGASEQIRIAKPSNSPETAKYFAETSASFKRNILEIYSGKIPLKANSLYSVDHRYKFTTCLAQASDVRLHGKRHSASLQFLNYTTPDFNTTFVYSTEPTSVDVSKISYTVSDDQHTLTLRMPPVYRAVSYQFSIPDATNASVLTLTDLDSSDFVEAYISNYMLLTEYCLKIAVIVKHPPTFFNEPNNKSETCFQFYSGPPNATTFRVVNVTKSSFEVRYELVAFAATYIIEVKNLTITKNYTTTKASFIATDDVIRDSSYDVRVAAQNPFGVGDFTVFKSTKFWNLTQVTNESIRLSWDTDPNDDSYEIQTIPGNNSLTVHAGHAVINGLDAGTVYSIKLYAVNREGNIPLFTIQQITAPGTPTLILKAAFPHGMEITWADLRGVDEYTVNISGRGIEGKSSRNSKPAKFSDLFSGVRYTVTGAFYNSAGFSGTESQFVTVLAKPTNISALSVSYNWIQVSWNTIPGALRYQVSAYHPNSTLLDNVTVDTTVANISNLEEGQEYSIIVTAEYDEGIQSSDLFLTATAVEPPNGLRLVEATTISLSVEWNKPRGSQYFSGSINGTGSTFNSTNAAHIFSNLKAGTAYEIVVRAHIRDRVSADLQRIFTTAPTAPILSITDGNGTSVTVSWNPVEGVTLFNVSVFTDGGVPVFGLGGIGLTGILEAVISGLQPTNSYIIRVTAIIGQEETNTTELRLDGVPTPPSNFTIQNRTATSLSLKWLAIPGVVGYQVKVKSIGFNTVSNETSVLIPGLSSGSRYEASILSIHDTGRRSSSVSGIFQTLPRSPDLVVIDATNSSLSVGWPHEKGAEMYEISLYLNTTDVFVKDSSTAGNVTEFTNLSSGTRYLIKSASTLDGERSNPEITLETLTRCTAPGGVRILSISHKSVSLEWNAAYGADRYDVIVTKTSRQKRSTRSNPTVEVSSTSARIGNLSSGSNYLLDVIAINDAGPSQGDGISISTGAQNPTVMEIVNVNTSMITIQWAKQPGATSYRVKVHRQGSQVEKENRILSSERVTLANLSPGIHYNVSVTTLSRTQPGNNIFENLDDVPSDTIQTAPSPPTEIKVTDVGDHLRVTWKASTGAEIYFVTLETSNTTFNTTDLNYTVPKSSYSKYNFTLVAVNSQDRRSDLSEPVVFIVKNNANAESRIPWWIFLIVAAFIATILIFVITIIVRRRRAKTSQPDTACGYYDLQTGERYNDDQEVALDDISLRDIDGRSPEPEDHQSIGVDEAETGMEILDGGHIGPQESIPSDEETEPAVEEGEGVTEQASPRTQNEN